MHIFSRGGGIIPGAPRGFNNQPPRPTTDPNSVITVVE